MDKPNEESLASLRKGLADIAQQIAAQDRRVQGIEDVSKSIFQRDEAIWRRLSGRWDLSLGILAIFTVVFTVLVIFLGYNAIEARQAIKDADAQVNQMRKDADAQLVQMRTQVDQMRSQVQETQEKTSVVRDLVKDAGVYSQILGELTEADVLITQGNREYEIAGGYPLAAQFAQNAIEKVTPIFGLTGIPIGQLPAAFRFDAGSCEFKSREVDLCKPSAQPQAALLRPATCEVAFAAHDLHAKATFAEKPDPVSLRKDAQILMILHGGGWQGYHWMGMVEEYEGPNSYRDAVVCLKNSIDSTKGEPNKDMANLAELEFVLGETESAQNYAEEYLNYLKSSQATPYGSSAGVLAVLYRNLAMFVKGDNKAFDNFRSDIQSKNASNLKAFSSVVLDEYLKTHHQSDAKWDEVRTIANCLAKKECGSVSGR